MATKLSEIVRRARVQLLAETAVAVTTNPDRFWNDDELLDHAISGARQMWREFIDLHEEHFMEVEESGAVTMPANGTQLAGVPADTFRIILIEPLDTTATGTSRGLKFSPRKFKSPEFSGARAREALDPSSGGRVYYALAHQGAPVVTATVLVAPKLSATLPLRFARVPILGDLTADSPNPIPGESDLALIWWTVAFARAKERDDRSPDPNALAIHTTEKKGILVASAPRQEQEAIVLKGVFDGEEADW